MNETKYFAVWAKDIQVLTRFLNKRTHWIATFERDDGYKLYILEKEIKMKLGDESPMPFGKYKGEKMANVPASYLMWLYDNNKCNAEVKEYINDNMDVLKQEIKNRI